MTVVCNPTLNLHNEFDDFECEQSLRNVKLKVDDKKIYNAFKLRQLNINLS